MSAGPQKAAEVAGPPFPSAVPPPATVVSVGELGEAAELLIDGAAADAEGDAFEEEQAATARVSMTLRNDGQVRKGRRRCPGSTEMHGPEIVPARLIAGLYTVGLQ